MRLDAEHPLNLGLLAYLRRDGRGNRPPVAAPSSVPNADMNCGSHPDIVERVWDQLGGALPPSCRCLVYGNPALVHDKSGVVLALALGTEYALLLPNGCMADADKKEMERARVYKTSGVRLDLGDFGPTWRFGRWNRVEEEWVLEVYLGMEAV